jgi:hypothetical protein
VGVGGNTSSARSVDDDGREIVDPVRVGNCVSVLDGSVRCKTISDASAVSTASSSCFGDVESTGAECSRGMRTMPSLLPNKLPRKRQCFPDTAFLDGVECPLAMLSAGTYTLSGKEETCRAMCFNTFMFRRERLLAQDYVQ